MLNYVYIHSCSDPHKWYNKFIGHYVRLLDEERDHYEFKCLQPDGYINYVDKNDGFMVSLHTDT